MICYKWLGGVDTYVRCTLHAAVEACTSPARSFQVLGHQLAPRRPQASWSLTFGFTRLLFGLPPKLSLPLYLKDPSFFFV